MTVSSPVEALGTHAGEVRTRIVKAVRKRHAWFAEAHQTSRSRYTMGFGSQWRDLLEDVRETLGERGYRTYKLPPAGYQLPVVNDCLVFVRRVGEAGDAASNFASSPTRVNGFSAPLLDPTLFEPGFAGEAESAVVSSEEAELEHAVREAEGVMPLILVTVHSSPLQLLMIDWAVAQLDKSTGTVELHGKQRIWDPEFDAGGAATDIESFDAGVPRGPLVQPREQEGQQPDA